MRFLNVTGVQTCALPIDRKSNTSELQSHSEISYAVFCLKKKKINLLMEAKYWGLRKSRNSTSLNSRFKSLDTLKVKIISVTFRRVIRTNHKKASKIWRHEILLFFFFNDTATTEIYTNLNTLSLHDALPI